MFIYLGTYSIILELVDWGLLSKFWKIYSYYSSNIVSILVSLISSRTLTKHTLDFLILSSIFCVLSSPFSIVLSLCVAIWEIFFWPISYLLSVSLVVSNLLLKPAIELFNLGLLWILFLKVLFVFFFKTSHVTVESFLQIFSSFSFISLSIVSTFFVGIRSK